MKALIAFWRATFFVPRVNLVLVALAIVPNLGSYAGLSMRGPFEFLVFLPVSVVLFGFVNWLTLGVDFANSVRAGRLYDTVSPVRTPIPSIVRWGLPLSLVYVLAVFMLLGSAGDGMAEIRQGQEVQVVNEVVVHTLPPGTVALQAARELRLFSAVTMFFGLGGAVMTHRALERRVTRLTGAQRAAV